MAFGGGIVAFMKTVAGKLMLQPVDDAGNALPVTLAGGGGNIVIAQAKATAADPVYVDGSTDDLSMTLDGYLRVYPKAAMKIQQITSNPVAPGPNVDLTADIVYITTSGSAGAEYINVPNPTPDAQGQGDMALAGHFVKIEMLAKGNAGDIVHVYLNASGVFSSQNAVGGNTLLLPGGVTQETTGVRLLGVGDATAFSCFYNLTWWTPYLVGYYDSSLPSNPPPATGVVGYDSGYTGVKGGAAKLVAGNATVGNADGGDLDLTPGAGFGTGRAGKIVVANATSLPGALAGTLTNAPAVGNPQTWLEVSINGVVHYIPAWHV